MTKKKAKWKTLLKTEAVTVEVTEVSGSFLFRRERVKKAIKVAVKLISSDEILGLYDDDKYARSRARYFYKRMMRKSEKILLG